MSSANLAAVVDRQLRDLTSWVLVVHQLITERLGLGLSDLKAVDLAGRSGGLVTAGRIAAATGLSTSAVTALLDRLEREGFVERRRDAADRRRVFVVSTGKREAEVARAFQPLQDATLDLLKDYGSQELELVTGFLSRLEETMARIAHAQAPRGETRS